MLYNAPIVDWRAGHALMRSGARPQHAFRSGERIVNDMANSLSRSSRGSTALAFMFTAFVALSVTFTFVNLVRYVGATNAVDQAARSTTRCLTPTDPDCVQYAAAPTQVMLGWWGDDN